MKISICMATYNGAAYLGDQLNSFLSQTRLPDELIISDDGSTDNTMEMLLEFSKMAPFPTKIFRNPRKQGISRNFCSAVEVAAGDLVLLCDQDDIWFDTKLHEVETWAKRDADVWLLMNDAEITNVHLEKQGFSKLDQIEKAGIDEKYFVMGCCSAIRRPLLELAMPIHENFDSHDDWFSFYGSTLDRKKIYRKSLQLYRLHENNNSQFIVNSTNRVNRALVLWHRVKKIFNKDQLLRQDKDELLRATYLAEANEKFKGSDYNILYDRSLVELNILKLRGHTRLLYLPKRIIKIVANMRNEVYGAPTQYRLVFRDLVG
ncbi:glycosyltransferase [Sulfitobacter sp. CW3]|uniref:glycosyltransferase n=1 Tax=Sulfitobacter sp. CW3 TaxID=2861965 RepID=UPI001C604C4D|nr:glycosyltransferase [Sulfitobacter sp. CW3]MBW4964188.1 glycosyltransferase [Sulfitobacter sp. CW3]